MSGNLPTVLSALVSDGFGLLTWQAGGTSGAGIAFAVQRLLSRRAEQARTILLDELRSGEKQLDALGVDEAIAILLRYGRAAQEGAARLNLRLMAKVIAGQAQHTGLYADEFLRYADVLSSLRREEVLLLGIVHRHWHSPEVRTLDTMGRYKQTRDLVKSELIPGVFQGDGDFYATVQAVMRTGLLRTADEVLDDFPLFQPTGLLDRLCELAPFEAAVRAEPM